MSDVVQVLLDATATGSLYALFALGIAVIFSVLQLVNLAHGEMITVGAFALVLSGGLPLPLRVVLALGAAVLTGLLVERVAFRPARSASPTTLLVVSFGASFVLQAVLQLAFGSLPRGVVVSTGFATRVDVLGAQVSVLSLVTLGVTAVLLLGLVVFLKRSSTGLRLRAAAEDFDMARALGVRADVVIASAFAVSGVLAGSAAVLLVAQTGQVSPTVGVQAMLFGLIGAVVGGLGSLTGAVLGGYLLGLLGVVLQVTLPLEIRSFRDAFLFLLVFVVLVLRPQGLLPTSSAARV